MTLSPSSALLLLVGCELTFEPKEAECPNYVAEYRENLNEDYPWHDDMEIDWAGLPVRARWIPCSYIDPTRENTMCLDATVGVPFGSDPANPPRMMFKESPWK